MNVTGGGEGRNFGAEAAIVGARAERERGRGKEKAKNSKCVCVCVCMRARTQARSGIQKFLSDDRARLEN